MTNTIAKDNMIKQQLRCCQILDRQIIQLFSQYPREDFVPAPYQTLAYADVPLSIGHEQVMMTPTMEAQVLQALDIQPDDKILEVGTGTGYLTALLAELGQHVYSVDIFPEFIETAQEKLKAHGVQNVTLQQGNAANGWDKQQPYDVICVTASIPQLIDTFRQQLKQGGRLFGIIGPPPTMEACLITRYNESQWHTKKLFETSVAPLLQLSEQGTFEL